MYLQPREVQRLQLRQAGEAGEAAGGQTGAAAQA